MAYRCRNDRQRTMEFVSERTVELTGYRPADLVTNRRVAFRQLLHPDDQEFVWKSIEESLEASRTVSSTMESQPLLGTTLEQLRAVMEHSGAPIFTLAG